MPLIILGHRGLGPTSRNYINQFLPTDIIPENSLLAFATAIDEGAHGIELDLYLSADNNVVISRDDILDRNVDGYHNCWDAKDVPVLGKISEMTLEEIQSTRYSLGSNQLIPSLEQLLDLIIEKNRQNKPRKILINLELQGDNLELADKVWSLMREHVEKIDNNLELNDFVINSFNIRQLMRFRQAQAANPIVGFSTQDSINKVELMLGVYTAPLFGNEQLLPGWIPIVVAGTEPMLDANQLPILKTEVDAQYVISLITKAKNYNINYLDIVSADLRPNLLKICAANCMNISMACNLLRSRAEYNLWRRDALEDVTDANLEQIQLLQIYEYSQKFPGQTFYYKADNVKKTLAFLRTLDLMYEKTTELSENVVQLTPNVEVLAVDNSKRLKA